MCSRGYVGIFLERTLYADKTSLRFMETCRSQNKIYGTSNGQENIDTTSKSRVYHTYRVYVNIYTPFIYIV